MWSVGIESPDREDHTIETIEMASGALATSGDARRFLIHDGIRYGHIVDPRTGWPVADAPRSVTVRAETCTEAGLIATMAILKGVDAESFLAEQGVRAWCVRS